MNIALFEVVLSSFLYSIILGLDFSAVARIVLTKPFGVSSYAIVITA